MKTHSFLVSCPQCGEQASLLSRELKHDRNLKLTCAKCGFVQLAMNAVQLAVYSRMKERGHPVGDPPVPEPLNPVRVFPGKDGTELVIKRHKTTGEVAYTRRAKRPKRPQPKA